MCIGRKYSYLKYNVFAYKSYKASPPSQKTELKLNYQLSFSFFILAQTMHNIYTTMTFLSENIYNVRSHNLHMHTIYYFRLCQCTSFIKMYCRSHYNKFLGNEKHVNWIKKWLNLWICLIKSLGNLCLIWEFVWLFNFCLPVASHLHIVTLTHSVYFFAWCRSFSLSLSLSLTRCRSRSSSLSQPLSLDPSSSRSSRFNAGMSFIAVKSIIVR